MPSICLTSNEEGTLVFAKGAISCLLDSRRSKKFLSDYTQFIHEGDSLVFSVSDTLPQVINRIKKAASYVNCEVTLEAGAAKGLAAYASEENKFAEFSKKANLIRDGEADLDDLKDFEESLLSIMTNRHLYDLQLLSSYHLAFAQNACNFSVPGAGKTSVVYGAYAHLSSLPNESEKKVDALMIVAPLNAFGPWEDEYEACFGRKPISYRLSGGVSLDKRKQILYSFRKPDIVLLSYASVPSMLEELKFFLREHRTMLVLDEAHKIKNTSGGVTAEGVLQLAEYAASRVVLTGTPAPNGYDDLFNLFKFIWPTKKIISYSVGQLRDMTKNDNDYRVPSLIQSISPFFVRVKKSDLNLPPVVTEIVRVHMSESQKRIYEFIESKYVGEMKNALDKGLHEELAKARLIRLMQAASNPGLLAHPLIEAGCFDPFELRGIDDDVLLFREILSFSFQKIPPKFEKTLSLVKEILGNGGKVVIWATFVKNVLGLQAYLRENGIETEVLYGGTPVNGEGESEEEEMTREKIVRRFNDPTSSLKVIVANPTAISESISLHRACHYAIYFERSFNAAQFIQSKDRIHRYGLPSDVITRYYYLISDDTIDAVIDERLDVKEKRLNEIIESMPIPLFRNACEETADEDIRAVILDYARRSKKN